MTRQRLSRLVPLVVVGLVATLGTSGTASAADTGLVLGYGMERVGVATVLDSSPSALPGRLLGAPAVSGRTTSVKGHGKALTFDSAQKQFVDAGGHAALDVNHFTLAAWVRYLPNVHDDRWEVLEKAGAYWMNIRTDTRKLRVGGFFGGCTAIGDVWQFVDSKKALPASTWVHVAGTYDGKALRIYVNGVLDNTLAVTGTTCVNTSPLGIGAKNHTAVGQVEAYFDGRIDDLRVYNRALPAAEIKTARATALT
jgi:Concanavalin A-like lectin/glucanases superfamily